MLGVGGIIVAQTFFLDRCLQLDCGFFQVDYYVETGYSIMTLAGSRRHIPSNRKQV